ncbi:MAG: hypothetical protein AB7O62_00010 [Pirellulales bacterium]
MNRTEAGANLSAGTVLVLGLLLAAWQGPAWAEEQPGPPPLASAEQPPAAEAEASPPPPSASAVEATTEQHPARLNGGAVLLVLFVALINLALGFALRTVWPHLDHWLSDDVPSAGNR